MFTKRFEQLNKHDADSAGGKGASLGEMTQVGIPVPPGFVVLAASFEQFLKETDLDVEVQAALDTVDHQDINSVEIASEKIRALIAAAKFPEDIAAEVTTQFKVLGAALVAVRSSATAEDSSEASWAGELESYLNVNEGDLLEKVKKCWGSLFTPRAIFYRFEKGLHTTKVSVAVVVQTMVQSQVAGITFTVHPITEDYDQMVIEAGWGLGEAIVSGSITPDTYVVNKTDWSIVDANIASQTKMITRTKAGSDWCAVPAEQQELQKISNQQIIELAKLCVKIEQHYGWPCDIEWAYDNETFYITQSRPITTLTAK